MNIVNYDEDANGACFENPEMTVAVSGNTHLRIIKYIEVPAPLVTPVVLI
jgi:hypothetical protein